MLSNEAVAERLAIQNVGDFERVMRTIAGTALLIASRVGPRSVRWPLGLAGAVAGLSGVTGWCPLYHAAGVTSMQGPGDRPDETTGPQWLAPRSPSGPSAAHPDALPAEGLR